MPVQVDVHFDLETTARGPDNSPEAYYPANKVVVAGWCCHWSDFFSETPVVSTGTLDQFVTALFNIKDTIPDGEITLVAHNLKFDLKYLLRDHPDIDWNKFKYRCTMTEEYLRSGHKVKFAKLEDLTALKKGLDLGAMIEAGLDVEDDIDLNELVEYLKEDVLALDEIPDAGYEMDYILTLAKMELNGLPLDRVAATNEGYDLLRKVDDSMREINDEIMKCMEWSDGTPLKASDFKPLAPRTMSYYCTGFPEHGLGGKNDKKHIVFKEDESPFFDNSEIDEIWAGKKPSDTLGYPINASVLDVLADECSTVWHYKQAKDSNKLVSTYIVPWTKQADHTGGTIHPKLNTCATNTGRLSSSSPNGQNIPPSMRALIKAPEGRLLYEIDFAQLEMIGAATLSNDHNMIADIQGGRDIHYQSGRKVFGWTSPSDMTKGERRTVKGVNFGLLYGGGAAGISENTGADKAVVQKLIDSFYDRYPAVKDWQEEVFNQVRVNEWTEGTKDGESYRASTYEIPEEHGGRTFYFEESVSPLWKQHKDGRTFSFKPTETKNYPIQGFAGGDIVMSSLSILDDMLADTTATMRMTVHDSIMLEWDEGKEKVLNKCMEEVTRLVRKMYSIPVPLRWDIESDSHWV